VPGDGCECGTLVGAVTVRASAGRSLSRT
jgi:hypothetical protein